MNTELLLKKKALIVIFLAATQVSPCKLTPNKQQLKFSFITKWKTFLTKAVQKIGRSLTTLLVSKLIQPKNLIRPRRTTCASSKQPAAKVDINATTDDDEIFYHIDSEQDIWDMWYQFFTYCKSDKTMHEFSLEKVGILQCGFTVEMRPCLIKESYSLLVVNAATVYNVFETYEEDIIRLFASEDHNRFDINLKHFKRKSEEDKIAVFIAKVFKLMSTISMNTYKLEWIKQSESNYSEHLVWQWFAVETWSIVYKPSWYSTKTLMKQVTNAIESDFICFQVGEYKLKSISHEIIRRNDPQLKSCSYKADGCHSVVINDNVIELSLLEVMGEFNLSDIARSTRDHVKGSFGALSLLQQIGYVFKYGTLSTFSSILIYFVHTLDDKIRLWSLEQVSPGVCIMSLVHTAVIPTQPNNSEVKMREVENLLWTYKLGLESTIRKIHQLNQEHTSIELSITRRTMNSAAATKLSDSFEKGCVLKIRGEYIAGYEQLQINSSI